MELEPLQPQDAKALSHQAVREALEKRGMKPTNFLADDQAMLQRIFNDEFEAEKEELQKRRDADQARKDREAAELRRRRQMERHRAEEEEAVNADHRVQFWMDLIQHNMTPPDAKLVISPVAARAVVKALVDNTSLTTLDLSRTRLGNDVGVEIAKLIRGNTTLVKLDLDENELGPVTAEAIGEALRFNSTLRSLSLEANPLTAGGKFEGFRTLCRALTNNSTLTSLNLWGTGAGVAGGKALATSLLSNPALVQLQVAPGDGIAFADLQGIVKCLDENLARYNAEQAVLAQRRREEAAAIREAEAKAAAERKLAEDEAWIQEQKELRAKAREQAAVQAIQDEIAARQAREEAETKRREEAARKEAEEKSKKKKGGKKKK